MIALDDAARAVDAGVLDSRGGFAWWYAEVLDHEGNGAVVIWAFGLPFLPGYTSAARRGEAQRPGSRPCLNVAVYQGGEPAGYLLHEFAEDDAEWDGAGSWRFGDSRIELLEHEGQTALTIHLDCPLAGEAGNVRGLVRVTGRTCRTGAACQAAEHCWTPLALPAFGTVMMRMGDGGCFSLGGRAYLDRNFSPVALHDLGIGRWLWGHAPMPDGERIFYVLWPDGDAAPAAYGFEVDRQGLVTESPIQVSFGRQARGRFGMSAWEDVTLTSGGAPWLRLLLDRCVDDGPFYLRYLARAEPSGAVGTAEIIDPDRVDLTRHRMLVKMRVSSDLRPGSTWLPLFEGERRGRFRRLFRLLLGSAA